MPTWAASAMKSTSYRQVLSVEGADKFNAIVSYSSANAVAYTAAASPKITGTATRTLVGSATLPSYYAVGVPFPSAAVAYTDATFLTVSIAAATLISTLV